MTERASVPCGSCRECCRWELVMLLPGDLVESYEHTIFTTPEGDSFPVLARKPNGDCHYLGENGCTIHHRAPTICREFDCRRFYLKYTRAERKRMERSGRTTKALFEAGRERLPSLGPENK